MKTRIAMLLVLLCSLWSNAAEVTLKPQRSWSNDRLIGMLMVSQANQRTKENPAGFIGGGLDSYLDSVIPIMRKLKTQSVIVWDSEGSEFEDTYIGAPSLAQQMNPAVSYDRFFKRLGKEGDVGLLIRPQKFSLSTHLHDWNSDPYETMRGEMRFARDRWKVKLFYVDSNVVLHPPPGQYHSQLIDATIFKRLTDEFKDCKIIPEHEDSSYYLWTFPYLELRMGEVCTPAYVRSIIPNARSLIMIADDAHPGSIRRNAAALRASGDRFLLPCWWWSPDVQDYYDCLMN